MDLAPLNEEQMTERRLGFGYWWISHKALLGRIATGAFGVVAFGFLAYGAYGFIDWFFISGVTERAGIAALARPAIDYAGIRARTAPQQLRIDTPIILSSGDKTYDITARAQNPNPQWWATFEYSFGDGSKPRQGFLLPGETKQLSALGIKSDARPGASKVSIQGLAWHRVDLHETRPDYATWANSRLGIRVSDQKFVAPSAGDAVPVWRATFAVTNDTAFGYYGMGFLVTLVSGNRIIGVNEVTISELRPGEKREVDASWYSELPSVTRIEVKPEVNIFDVQSYIPAGR